MDDAERERLERILEAISLAGNPDRSGKRLPSCASWRSKAKAVEEAGVEAKLSRLKGLLQDQGFFDEPEQRLLIFTEFKDTLDYLVERLKSWGFRVGCIHGGMESGSRDEPGTRLYAEQQFREGAIQILVATEAAGEGINLQCCHILFNYDIPWNPNRLEQRMGRIHRYGQKHDCLIFNFVATNTIEGRVLQRLLREAAGDPRRLGRRRGVQRRGRGTAGRPGRAGAPRLLRRQAMATPTSRTGCCGMWMKGSSAPSARTPWRGWRRRS